jgi:hypothetical protein
VSCVSLSVLRPGLILSADKIYQYIQEIHSREQDFEDGDLGIRIYKHKNYEFVPNFPLSKLDLAEWEVDQDTVHDWVQTVPFDTMPPIVVGAWYRKFKRHTIIDGIHRANYALTLGHKTVPAFVRLVKTK